MQTAAIPEPSPSEALPTIRVLAESDDQATQRVAAEFKAAFSGFDTLDLIDSDFADQQHVAPDPMSFVLTAARGRRAGRRPPRAEEPGQRQGASSTASCRLRRPSPEAVADVVANVASGVAPVSGMIYGYLEQSGLQSQLTECLTLNDAYYHGAGSGAAPRCVPMPGANG